VSSIRQSETWRVAAKARQAGWMAGHIHVVDDDPSFLMAIERRLTLAGYEVTVYASAQQLLDRLASASIPSCILLDVRIPGLSGPELQERLIELGLSLPIIFVSGYTDIPLTVRALKAGAQDFLTKPVASDELFRVIEKALAHHQASQGQRSRLDGVRARIAKLTPRERQVFDLIVRGNTNKAIGRVLGCTERTVKAHRHRVMEKMQVRTLAELVSLAERIGFGSDTGRTTF
jgi:FixJ family two-component response regulator